MFISAFRQFLYKKLFRKDNRYNNRWRGIFRSNAAVDRLDGEGHNADDMVWINKTHYPINAPMLVNSLNINKQIYLMRNPIDVILSCANMTQTTSHALVPKEEYYKDFPEFWDEWITSQVNSM